MIARLTKEFIRWVNFEIKKRQAILAWKATGKRHWVIPVQGTRKMAVLNTDEIAAYNKLAHKRGWRKLDIKTLLETALYGTPIGSTMERKRRG